MDNKTLFKTEDIGRFRYIEPMNVNLDLADNATVFNNEDYCIAVDLEVEIPSRMYGDEPRKIYASSNNGSISFLGGVQTGENAQDDSQGYLSTSWTDVSVSNNVNGNKETLGIESINISYSPNFFPVVNIKFVDVRGSSLFMPQQKGYEYTIAKNNSADLTQMDAGSFFKALFTLPSPIFKLTVKGFYGEPVTYKLLMSKSSFDFDSENGNFVANVEFAGYMYGIYTDLPMSLIASAPYLDGKKYWNQRKTEANGFKFDNGKGQEMETIPEIIKKISKNASSMSQEVSQSKNGKKFQKVNELLEILNEIKSSLPFRISDGRDGFKKYKEEKSKEGNYVNRVSDALKVNSKGINEVVISAATTYSGIEEALNNRPRNTYSTQKQVYYQILETNIDLPQYDYKILNSDKTVSFALSSQEEVNKCKRLIEILTEKTDLDGRKTFTQYGKDFEELIKDCFGGIYLKQGVETTPMIPAWCLIGGEEGERKVLGFDLVNLVYVSGDFFKKGKSGKYEINQNKILTYPFLYKNPRTVEGNSMNKTVTINYLSQIAEYLGVSSLNSNTTYLVNRICTNIPDMLDRDIEFLTKKKDELQEIVEKEFNEKLSDSLGFNLTIKNIYELIFAHIETFMHYYYGVLKQITEDENNRNTTILGYRANISDVNDKLLEQGNVPPYPTIIKEKEKNVVVYPKEVLNSDIPETQFVEDIINAIINYGDTIEQVKKDIERYRNANNDDSLTFEIEKFIPLTITDMILNNSDYNPYKTIAEEKNGVYEIWFTFIMRCLYFAIMFKKYASGMLLSDISSESVFLNNVCKYIGAVEASNFKKAFGNNISSQLKATIRNSISGKTFNEFLVKNILNLQKGQSHKVTEHKVGNSSVVKNSRVLGNFVNSPLFSGEASTYGYKYSFIESDNGNKYMVLPIKNYDRSQISKDVSKENGYPCLTKNEEYVIFKVSGNTIIETSEKDIFNGKLYILNENTIKIIESDTEVFKKFISLINDDSTYNSSLNGEDKDVCKKYVLEPFYGNYLGSGVTLTPYLVYNNELDKYQSDIFIYDGTSNEFDALAALSGESVFIQTTDKINIAGCFNNRYVSNTVDAIENGLKIKDSVYKYIEKGSENEKVLSAYLFLYSIPIDLRYSYKARFANMEKITKTCLLREGAQYFWEDNFDVLKSSFISDLRNNVNLTKNSIPVIKNNITKDSLSPTLWLSDSSNAEFLTWELSLDQWNAMGFYKVSSEEKIPKPVIPINRRNTLKQYFLNWVNQYYVDLVLETNKNGLTEDSMKEIIDLYSKEVIYVDYAEPVVRNMGDYVEHYNDFIQKCYESFVNIFNDTLYPKGVFIIGNMSSNTSMLSHNVKLPIYQLLQTLYVKHLAGSKFDRWYFGSKVCDFRNFLYMDSYYNEIGDKLCINANQLIDIFQSITPNVNNLFDLGNNQYKDSVYEILSLICQKNGLTLIAMPINPLKNFTTFNRISSKDENSNEKCDIWQLFNTLSYNSMRINDSSCFLALYTYKPSEHLDIEDVNGLNGFANDSFSIKTIDNGKTDMPVSLRDESSTLPKIPSFGVTYAKQNQSIFKNVNVGTSSHQVTEASIGMLMNLASQADRTPRESILYGQDIYNIFANYSYTSEVEMMGCAPISPFMYYQLNNIPLFKGAYQIFSVEHNITAGNMTTKFKGYRVNKNAIPLVGDASFLNEDRNMNRDRNSRFSEGDEIKDIRKPDKEVEPKEEPIYDAETIEEYKRRMNTAYVDTFNCNNTLLQGETGGMCARYTYNMAYGYMKGNVNCTIAGGNADDESYFNALIKLGYREESTKEYTYEDVRKYIEDKRFYPGDVLIYYSTDGVRKHTQIYVGEYHSSSVNNYYASKWASSVKNNYGDCFVYNKESDKERTWVLRVLRANPE